MAGSMIRNAVATILVCPVCYQGLAAGPDAGPPAWLHCATCGRYYPVQDGIPVLLAQLASNDPPGS